MRTLRTVDTSWDGVVVGRHSIWLPRLEVKIPFQFGGRITKYQHDEASYDPAETLPHEIAILRALAAEGMAPPIGEVAYVETLVSMHRGAWHADPIGAWGYEMADANRLPPGRFSIEAMQRLPIVGSPGAWNDISVAGRGNVVNGYLVDVRRSAFDMLRFDGPVQPLPTIDVDLGDLCWRIHCECQFPAGEREGAYQDFYLGGAWCNGQRRVVERAAALGFAPRAGDTVLDIGCQAGGFLQYAALRHVAMPVGVEVNPGYIDCARALARSCRQNICIRQIDVVKDRAEFLAWVRAYFPGGRPDHCLALSMEKHLGENFLFSLIDEIGARTTYIETNAVSASRPMKMWDAVVKRGGRHVGDSNDRNLRRLYQIGAP